MRPPSKIKARVSSANLPRTYLSAIILGLNDALVEMTGALAGFTMALSTNRLIVLAGFTTGISAALSMAAAEFFSQENAPQQIAASRRAIATGIAYLLTVAILLLPFFVIENPIRALLFCLLNSILIIIIFNYYTSRQCGTNFRRSCLQMLCVNVGVAAIAFCLSWGAKVLWGINLE